VDLEVIRFLISSEDGGTELIHTPAFIREWMLRERAEGADPDPTDAGLTQ